MKKNLIPSIKLSLIMLLLFSAIYPIFIWGIAQLTPWKGVGEVIIANGNRYYTNVGQKFDTDRYFYGRPSAVNYNAAGSGGSNKGPSNKEYLLTVQARIDAFIVHNPEVPRNNVPVEMVTASGSGLDPDISRAGALIQVKRIATARRLDEKNVQKLIEQHTEKPLLGIFGPEKINILKLNLALDKLSR
jgi:potassium-transporting ATPase KdpC subunit